MFDAIGRFFRWIGYALTGRIDSTSEGIAKDPHAMRGAYDDVIRGHAERVRQYKHALAGLVAQREKKKSQLEALTADVERLEGLKAGALAKAKKVAGGKSKEALATDAEYQRCRAAYADFASTLAEKEQRAAELEEDISAGDGQISGHKVQLGSMLRELEKLRTEREEAVADVLTAKEEQEVADLLVGISDSDSGRVLQQLRDVRSRAKANAKVSTEMAGVDAKREEAEFLEYARDSAANDEFDSLVLGETAGAAPAEADPVAVSEPPSGGSKGGDLPG